MNSLVLYICTVNSIGNRKIGVSMNMTFSILCKDQRVFMGSFNFFMYRLNTVPYL